VVLCRQEPPTLTPGQTLILKASLGAVPKRPTQENLCCPFLSAADIIPMAGVTGI